MSCSDDIGDFKPVPEKPLECVMKTVDESQRIGYGMIIVGCPFLLLGGLAKCIGVEADSSKVTGGDQKSNGSVAADSKSAAPTEGTADCKDCKSCCTCFLNCLRPCWYIWIFVGLVLTVIGILFLAKVKGFSYTHDDPVNRPCYRRGQQKDSDPALIDTVEDVPTSRTGTNTKSCRCTGKCTSNGFASCRTDQSKVECPNFA